MRAQAELERRRRERTRNEALLDFIPRVSPKFSPPVHLAPVIRLLERAVRGESIRALVSVPPRHAKTETILHSIAWGLSQNPSLQFGYIGYAETFARSKSRRARDLARASHVAIRSDADALNEWRTPEGGGVLATGIGGPLTGHGVDILLVDDPHKNREEAESTLLRQGVYEWFTSTGVTRVEPHGAIIVVHTRWHSDDLIGRLERESAKFAETGGLEGEHWDLINLRAVDETTGEALWPDRWPVDVLERRRRTIGEYEWAALFQGRPRPRGARLFREPVRYEHPEIAGRRLIIGVDVAGTKSSRADWTVATVLAFTGEADELAADVLEVLRLQEEIPQVCRELEALQKKWNAPLVIEGSGIGKAVPQTLLDVNPRLRIEEVHPTEDKFTRAQAYAAGWNQGRVRLPASAGWLPEFLRVHTDFTGVNDRHDDDVDAAVHAWNYALSMPPLKVERQPQDVRSRSRLAGMGRGYG
jgi:predicted phage terminase large subunit-like protein